MRGIVDIFIPPKKWKFYVIIILGIITGLIFFLFYVSKAHSYLSDNAETCMNCHIMAPQYTSWFHSAHRQYANCNECHVPHDNVFNKYFFKAKDGLRHATIFTLRKEPQVIRIHEAGKEVVHSNCLRCHGDLLTDNKLQNYNGNTTNINRKSSNCTFCHRETPHGSVNSLSSVPNSRVPLPESAVPHWLKKMITK
ncbi:MAG: cytochrome c nitrite reductase small subunit [Bacteroidales bacterium]|nr:cytochrome c nitrite reductase small subunit [Bacteroidales bacterium]